MSEVTPASKPAALAFESVSFGYGRRLVVRGITAYVAPGEMIGLLGPNGAGKSTLLKLAAGVLHPLAGRILVHGSDLRQLGRREIARAMAVVPQDFAVQFAYTVRQIVQMGRLPHQGMLATLTAADRERVDAALAAAHVADLADRVFNELSGGERQRVLIALVLAQDAGIVLLDEPTAHLDIKHQIEVLELLRTLNREQHLTVLAALHDLNLAARYFPRLMLFRGEIVADGPPARVLDGALLSEVYETPVQVGILRGEEHLSVLPPASVTSGASSPEMRRAVAATPRVHVLAGGGTGDLLMRALADAQIAFSAGPLNIGDSDYTLAERLAVCCIAEPPYAPISAEALVALRAALASAGCAVICPAPLGHGNVAMLIAALDACREGVRVLLLEPSGASAEEALVGRVAERDFSRQGVEIYPALLAAGARVVTSPGEAVHALATLMTNG